MSNKMSYATVKRIMLSTQSKMETDWWNTHSPISYKTLNIIFDPTGKLLRELKIERKIERKILGLLIAARSGHGDYKAYHERFGHEKYENCSCGADKTSIHFFFCRETRNKVKREIGMRRSQEAIDWLLSTPQGATAFSRIMENI